MWNKKFKLNLKFFHCLQRQKLNFSKGLSPPKYFKVKFFILPKDRRTRTNKNLFKTEKHKTLEVKFSRKSVYKIFMFIKTQILCHRSPRAKVNLGGAAFFAKTFAFKNFKTFILKRKFCENLFTHTYRQSPDNHL